MQQTGGSHFTDPVFLTPVESTHITVLTAAHLKLDATFLATISKFCVINACVIFVLLLFTNAELQEDLFAKLPFKSNIHKLMLCNRDPQRSFWMRLVEPLSTPRCLLDVLRESRQID